MKKRLLALLMCAALVLALAGCTSAKKDEGSAPTKEEEGAAFTLKIVHGDGTEVTKDVTTHKDTLGEALLDEGLIAGEEGAYGLFVKTVDGETVDDAKEQWWCLTRGGQQVNTGVDSTPVEDGATFEFTLTTGY